jgi:hypothetical protein
VSCIEETSFSLRTIPLREPEHLTILVHAQNLLLLHLFVRQLNNLVLRIFESVQIAKQNIASGRETRISKKARRDRGSEFVPSRWVSVQTLCAGSGLFEFYEEGVDLRA